VENKNLPRILDSFVKEDVGSGDVTTKHTPERNITAVIATRQRGIVAGIEECCLLLSSNGVGVIRKEKDGSKMGQNQIILKINGSSRKILTLERTLLNILSRMSGIATRTNEYVRRAREGNPKIRVAATRKTTPLFRYFEKRAVVLGGGHPHRQGLYDQVLIKDNHLVVFGGVGRAVEVLKKKTSPMLKIEVEVTNPRDALIAIHKGADIIMLDNMSPNRARKTIEKVEAAGLRKVVEIEVSGGVRLNNIKQYAKTGADVVSSSDLICGAKSLDFTLYLV
jgi:nicotinate-nucleotide pyrophosphorylase (carboxylating)